MANPFLHIATAAALLVSGPAEKAYDGAAGELSVATPSVPRAEIRVDGRLDDAAWAQAALLHSFTQYDPVEGVAASQKTEVLVLVDDDAIYFGVRAFDDRPGGIRATLAERDGYTRSDDYIRFVLDTFNDQRRAYVFSVNPLGVQHDGIWNEGGGGRGGGMFGPPIDDNPDFLWESAGVLVEWGYALEVRIPLKSLRFPELAEQSWGLQVLRRIARNGFEESWAPVSNNVANKLTQAGKLTGLKDLDAGLFMEINPVLTGKRLGDFDDGLQAIQRESPEADFGLNLTYGLTSNLTLDATYNPDFSQVEADAGQISVNERFALFFPEKRPFFLEGTEVFNLPKQLVYTRSIANPIAGAKMTGKMGSWNVGYLGAVDEAFDDADNTLANILRVRRDLGASSTLGMVYTDRTRHADDYNRVGGVDARLVLARRYTLTFLGSASLEAAPGEDRVVGGLWSAKAERAGRAFSFSAEVEDSDHDFSAGSGFLRRTGITDLQANLRLNRYGGRGSLVERWGPSFEVGGTWDHDDFWGGGAPMEGQLQLSTSVSFRGNVSLWGTVQRNFFDFAPDLYDGFFVEDAAGGLQPFRPDQERFGALDGVSLNLFVNTFERVRGNLRVSLNETPVFDRGLAIAPARSLSTNLSLNLYPTRSLQGEVGIRQTRITRDLDGEVHSSALIPRVRAQYQFSRALFVRGIFEYSAQERMAPVDPATGRALSWCEDGECTERTGRDAHDFHMEGLVSYEPSPGTVFYVGYTRQMEDLDPQEFRFGDLRTTQDGLFVKVSYRFRF
ncbi:MAG: hypothetical protein AMXMBFR53_36110 [Gemmatimonadota bacterium]